jgi:carbamoyltransferase
VPAREPRARKIPAVVHVDGTSRVQVVRKETNRAFWDLITRFGAQTGVPVILNTSFNVKGEPIVCTPTDAVRCFLTSGLDALSIEDFVVTRKAQAS